MIQVLIGLAGGLLIGATGIGSGSVIAPLLILAGYSPAAAVGTGLTALVASKLTAAEVHRQMGHLPRRNAAPLIRGGLAGVTLTWLCSRVIGYWNVEFGTVIKVSLGAGLVLAAAALLAPRRRRTHDWAARFIDHPVLLFALGAAVAVAVALTSAGAGGLLIPALLIITRWEPAELAAVSNFYGVAVGASSLFLYLSHHSLDFSLITFVLIGLLPGVVFGARLSHLLSRRLLSRGAGLIAGYVGFALLFSRS